jgi:hypothetical protein
MGLDKDFLKIGDVIEVCGFALKEEVVSRRSSEDTDGLSPPFVHGHVLVMPDGQMQSWGPYGKLDNCVRPDDQRQAWLDLLRRDPLAREFWCDRWRASIPTRATSRALADEIKSLMAVPCD